MNVVYLHQYFNTPAMSGGTRSYEMARRLVAAGHHVDLITSWREPEKHRSRFVTEEAGIRVHWLPVPYSNAMGYARRMRSFARFGCGAARVAASLDCDLVFATSTPLTIALPAVYASRRHKCPMVFEVRDVWPEVPIALKVIRNPLLKRGAHLLERFAYRNSVRIVALAPGMKDKICRTGYPPERVAVIPNGCDVSLFQECGGNQRLLERYPQFAGKRLILYVGTIGKANGVEYIPKLAAAISGEESATDVCFGIVGDGKQLEHVKSIASELGVLDRSVFFVGSVPKQDVPNWMHLATATLMTYDGPEVLYEDSVSNKFFDSLAAGRPILANFRGFSTVIAEANGAGEILPREDFEQAAKRVLEWVRKPKVVRKGMDNAFRLAKNYFDRDILANNLLAVLEDAVNTKDTSAETGSIGNEYRELQR